MADVLISNLPTYTASTVTGTYFIINNSDESTTFKATREQFVPVAFGTGNCSLVGGDCNTVSTNCSAVVSGKQNTINSPGDYSFIAGGSGNTVSGCFSSVLGGNGNNVTGSCAGVFGSNISAGNNNTFYVNNLSVDSTLCSATINTGGLSVTGFTSGCGVCVTSGGIFTTYTAAGVSPMSTGCGTCSIVGNCSVNGSGFVCDYTFLGGGCFNSGYGTFSFIGGGQCNNVNSCHQVIVGGRSNYLSSCQPYSTIGGGFYNSPAAGFGSFVGVTIAGGIGNGTCGGSFDTGSLAWCTPPSCSCMCAFGFIGGGFQNNSWGCGAVVVGGFNNINCGAGSFLGGGQFNSLNGYCSVLNGGLCNSIVGTGFGNVLNGGYLNKIANGGYHFMGAGFCNTIGCCNFSSCYNNVVGGTKAYVDGQFGFIGNSADCNVFSACSNLIACGTYGSTILNGACNSVCGSFSPGCVNVYSTILGGCSNSATCCFNLLYGCGNFAMGDYTNIIGCGIMGSSSCTTYFNNVCVCGTLSKVSGSFKIPHPDPSKTNKFLQHSFVEAPTAGENIYRHTITTTNCSSSLELPDYYKFLNGNDQVFVTPKNHFGSAYGIINQEQTCVSFCSNCDGEYNVLIIGTRKDKEAQKYWKGTEVNEVQQ
jgi:hypothetical protein